MKRLWIGLAALLLAAVPAFASTVIGMSVEDHARLSTHVVLGTIVSQVGIDDPEMGIETAVTIKVKHDFKQLAKAAGVEKIDAGPKGGTLAFRNNAFAQPLKLVQCIAAHSGTMKVRPDQKVVVTRDWPTPDERLAGIKALLSQLAKLAK